MTTAKDTDSITIESINFYIEI